MKGETMATEFAMVASLDVGGRFSSLVVLVEVLVVVVIPVPFSCLSVSSFVPHLVVRWEPLLSCCQCVLLVGFQPRHEQEESFPWHNVLFLLDRPYARRAKSWTLKTIKSESVSTSLR